MRRHHRNLVTIQPPIAACRTLPRGCLTSGSTAVCRWSYSSAPGAQVSTAMDGISGSALDEVGGTDPGILRLLRVWGRACAGLVSGCQEHAPVPASRAARP
jgi:hypothetical protein